MESATREEARRLERPAIDLVGPEFNGSTKGRPQKPETDDDDDVDGPLIAEEDEEPRSP